ncbi:hypothetical protein Tco_0524081 [Tanacetum coccineum]
MSSSDYIYPIIVPSDVDVEDAFSSTHSSNYTPASLDYSPASLGNTSPNPSDDLFKYLLASLAISPFHNDPYMKVIMVNVILPDHDHDVPIVEPNQHDVVLVVPKPVLEDEDEDPEEDEFKKR